MAQDKDACSEIADGSTVPRNVTVSEPGARIYIYPQGLPDPLVSLSSGVVLRVVSTSFGQWLFVRFEDDSWGSRTMRVGYIHCSSIHRPSLTS